MVQSFGPASPGIALAGRGALIWYADGAAVPVDPVSGRPLWRPATPDFYAITAVDADGRRARARVRVIGSGG